jgi:class 3 adenylate cyclase/tetratricopeptide (TPR) repeat protein
MAGAAIRRERRVVTALFADLVGSTALTESLDPEDAMELLGGAISQIVLLIEDLGGTVKDLAGDGVLALFGAPIAHEDDVERAIHAGLRIAALFDKERAAAASDVPAVDVRVGVETGLVVLGPVGAGSHVEYGATGDTVNTAARLQAAAEPGTVLVGPTARRLAEGRFRWGPGRELSLKGKAEPVTAWPARAAVTRHAGARLAAPLVGRERELAGLGAAVDRALEGGDGLAVLLGDGGVGKGRLLHEARKVAEASTDALSWITLRCASYEQRVPFAPLRRLFERWLGIRARTDPATAAELVRTGFAGVLDTGDPELDLAVELVLGLPPSETLPPSPESAGELAPFRVATAVEEILGGLAARRPVVVVIEDLQWADRATLDLIDHLVARDDALPCLLVLTGRPVEGHPLLRWAELAASGLRERATLLRLGPLPPAAAEALMAAYVGEGTLPVDLERSLLDTAEGNPYFLEELVRALIDSGALVRGPHGWEHDPSVAFTVPPTLERVVLERLDRLDPAARDLLESASVIGRTFDVALLAAVADRDEGETTVMLKELASLGLVERGDDRWRFTHQVVHDAAYSCLLRKARRDMHRRVAEVLSARDPQAAAELARHWWEAGEAAVAAALAERAAADAEGQRFFEEAAQHYAMAVEGAGQAGAERSDLLLALAHARRRAGLLRPALEAYQQAHGVAARSGDVGALATSALGYEDTLFATRAPRSATDPTIPQLEAAARGLGEETSARRVRVLAALGRALSYSGRSAEGSAAAAEAVELARAVGDPSAAAYALLAWRTDRLGPECLSERLPLAGEALEAAERAGDGELWVEAGRALFVDLLAAGRRAEADAVLERLAARILAQRQPFHLWYLGMWRVQQALLDGDLDLAERAAEEFRRQGRGVRYGDVDSVYVFFMLLILRERGRAAGIEALLDRLAGLDRTGAPRWPVLQAALAAETGRLDDARRRLGVLGGDGFASLPDDQSRTALLALLADTASITGDAAAGDRLAALLAPWSGQALVVGAGAGCMGAADHYLGLLTGSRELLLRGRALHVALQAPLLVARSDRALDALP